jgi:hypothetical protein
MPSTYAYICIYSLEYIYMNSIYISIHKYILRHLSKKQILYIFFIYIFLPPPPFVPLYVRSTDEHGRRILLEVLETSIRGPSTIRASLIFVWSGRRMELDKSTYVHECTWKDMYLCICVFTCMFSHSSFTSKLNYPSSICLIPMD